LTSNEKDSVDKEKFTVSLIVALLLLYKFMYHVIYMLPFV